MSFTVTDSADTLTISVPARRSRAVMILYPLGICFWLFGEISTINVFVSIRGDAFLIFWLAGWTLGGFYAIYIWLWQLIGVEVVEVTSTTLNIQRRIAGIGRAKCHNARRVRKLRIAPLTYDPIDPYSGIMHILDTGESIVFDDRHQSVRFASGAEAAERQAILQMIADRLQIRVDDRVS